MLKVTKMTLDHRLRKTLLIALVLLIVVTLLGYQGTLSSALQKTSTLVVPIPDPKPSPEDTTLPSSFTALKPTSFADAPKPTNSPTDSNPPTSSNEPKLPELSEWVKTAPAWTTSQKTDPNFNITQSFLTRQEIGRNLVDIFRDFRPPISAVNPTYLEKWPQMPPLVTNKKYVVDEVVAASANFFLEDKDYTEFKEQQQSLIRAIPTWANVSKAYSGRGIVISAGAQHLERVWPNTVLMIRSLGSKLPIEVWTKDREEYDRTLPIVYQMRTELNMPISVHTIADYIPVVFGVFDIPGIFKVKPLSLMFSSFEETILLDVDSVPVMDPNILFESEEAKTGLIQWPVCALPRSFGHLLTTA
jgi:hypothetical protein